MQEDGSIVDDFFSFCFFSDPEMEDWGLIDELGVKQLLAKALTLPA